MTGTQWMKVHGALCVVHGQGWLPLRVRFFVFRAATWIFGRAMRSLAREIARANRC